MTYFRSPLLLFSDVATRNGSLGTVSCYQAKKLYSVFAIYCRPAAKPDIKEIHKMEMWEDLRPAFRITPTGFDSPLFCYHHGALDSLWAGCGCLATRQKHEQ
jgi:hypothetical protein